MKFRSQSFSVRPCLLALAGYVCLGSLPSCCSHSIDGPHAPELEVPLGLIQGDRLDAQLELANLLGTNGIEFGGGGSKIFEIDVPANKLDFARSLLRRNRLVIEHIFLLSTNASRGNGH